MAMTIGIAFGPDAVDRGELQRGCPRRSRRDDQQHAGNDDAGERRCADHDEHLPVIDVPATPERRTGAALRSVRVAAIYDFTRPTDFSTSVTRACSSFRNFGEGIAAADRRRPSPSA